MENDQQQGINPLNPGTGEIPTTEPTTPLDLGDGTAREADSIFGSDGLEVELASSFSPEAKDTVPFTQAAAMYVTPTVAGGASSAIPDGTSTGFTAGEANEIGRAHV